MLGSNTAFSFLKIGVTLSVSIRCVNEYFCLIERVWREFKSLSLDARNIFGTLRTQKLKFRELHREAGRLPHVFGVNKNIFVLHISNFQDNVKTYDALWTKNVCSFKWCAD